MRELQKTLTLFFTLIITIISVSTQHSFALSKDGVLLLSFKFSILKDPLHVLKTWTVFDDTPCSWHGVTCGLLGPDKGRVTGVSLPGSQLLGTIPATFGLLNRLQTLNLSSNSITGPILDTLLSLPTLRVLDVSDNLISGQLSDSIGGGNIRFFNLSYNHLTGDIPPKFGRSIPRNATLIFSYNNFTGNIPDSSIFLNQEKGSFAGNPNLCGRPLSSPCAIPSSSNGLSMSSNHPAPHPVIAAIPKFFASSSNSRPQGSNLNKGPSGKSHGHKPRTIACIVIGNVSGIFIICMVLFLIYKIKTKNTNIKKQDKFCMSCLRKGGNDEEESEGEESVTSLEDGRHHQENEHLVTLDGESQLELETLLKASAYILGASGSSIMYKAVLEDKTVLAVRRIGENCSVEKLKDFEGYVKGVAKMVHPNLVRVRGFYWSVDEKLVIYEYIPGGSLANARYRKGGYSPCHIPWEVRLRIAKGVARGLSYIHEKKHVHGNLKPSNILLDMDMEPKIVDFGLDKLITGKSGYTPGGSTHHFGSKRSTTSRDSFQDFSVGATPSPSTSSIGCVSVSPYHPPESLRNLKPSSKSDVYSFGVVLLELLTGKVIISDELGPPVLAGMAVGLDDKTRVLRMVDPAIRVELEGKEEDLLICLKLGYDCVSYVPQKRPTMKEVVQVLDKISASPISSYHDGL